MKRFLSGLGLICLLVVSPFIIHQAVGGPYVPRIELGQLRQTLTGPLISLDAVLRMFGWLTWALWAYLVLVVLLRAVAIVLLQRGFPVGERLVSATSSMAPAVLMKLVDVTVGGLLLFGPISLSGAIASPHQVAPAAAPSYNVSATTAQSNGQSHAEASDWKSYVVRPGDSLWRIAERELGAGDRWPEIHRLNEGRHFPDGRVLRNPRLIRPNWVLWLPVVGSQEPAAVLSDTTSNGTASQVPVAPAVPTPAQPSPSSLLSTVDSSENAPDLESDAVQEIEQPSPAPVVNLRSGAALAASFASGILATQALALLRRRRQYRPEKSRGHGLEEEPMIVADLRRAHVTPLPGRLESALVELARTWTKQTSSWPAVISAIEFEDSVEFEIGNPGKAGLDSTPRIQFIESEERVRVAVKGPFVPIPERPSPLQSGILVPVGANGAGGAAYCGLAAAGTVSVTGINAEALVTQSILSSIAARRPEEMEVFLLGDITRFDQLFGLPHVRRAVSWAESSEALRELELEVLGRSRFLTERGADEVWDLIGSKDDAPFSGLIVVVTEPPETIAGILEGLATKSSRVGCAFVAAGWTLSTTALAIESEAQVGVSGTTLLVDPLRPLVVTSDQIEDVLRLVGEAHRQEDQPSSMAEVDLRPLETVTDETISSEGSLSAESVEDTVVPSPAEEKPSIGESEEAVQVAPVTSVESPVELQLVDLPEARCLGTFLVSRGDGPPIMNGWKARSKELLAYLIAHRDGLPKDRILETLWGEVPLQSAERLLRNSIYFLRKQASKETDLKWSENYVKRSGDLIMLDREGWWIDAWELESTITSSDDLPPEEAIRVLRRVLPLYRGEFCDDAYYSWAEPVRERYRRLCVDGSASLAELLQGQGDSEGALEALERGIAADPVSEELYRRAITIEASLGRTNAARSRYRKLVSVLAEELGEDPEPATQELMRGLGKPARIRDLQAQSR